MDYNLHVKSTRGVVIKVVVCALIVPLLVLFYKYGLHANVTTVALTFLLAVLVVSANWGFWYAVVLAVYSTLAFNFFFLPPFGTFTIADPQNWVALFAFLATAVIAGQLSERARRETVRATQRRREIEQLYAFTPAPADARERARVAEPRSSSHHRDIWLPKGRYCRFGKNRCVPLGCRHAGDRCIPHALSYDPRGTGLSTLDHALAFIPLRLGVRTVGAIGISGTTLSHESLEALSTLVAITIERTRAIENVGKAEVARENEKLRSAILDSIAHEFRTPLTSIKASVTSLLSGGFEDSQENELLTVINEESDRLNHLVEEATQLARLEAKQVELELTSHDVSEAIDRAVESAKKVSCRSQSGIEERR